MNNYLVCGGSWYNYAVRLRIAIRNNGLSGNTLNNIAFRIIKQST